VQFALLAPTLWRLIQPPQLQVDKQFVQSETCSWQWTYAQNRFRSRNANEARKTADRLRFVIVVLDPVREIEELATPWVRGDLYNTDKWVSAYDVHDTPRSKWS